jgi:DNA-binding IclR family transcriptional regulator
VERALESIQSIERAAAILSALAAGGGQGRRLIDLAADTGLGKSTAFRILGTLVRTGLVEQDQHSGHFYLGLRFFALGVASANRYGLAELASDAMRRLADRTADTVYLSIRSGTEAVCVDRVTGSFPIKTLTLHAGDRRPLGIGAGSLALLAWLPDQEVRRIIDANAPLLTRYPNFDAATLLELVDASRRQGYAFNDRMVIPGMCAVGAPILGKDGHPVAALSVAAIESRMQPGRRADIAAWLTDEARTLQERLTDATAGLTQASVRRLVNEHA